MIARLPPIFGFVFICICLRTTLARQAQNPEPPADSSAAAGTIGKVDVKLQAHGLAIEIAVSAPLVPQGIRLTNPDRLVFDFPGYGLRGANRHLPINHGPVLELRLSLFSIHPPMTRLVVASREPLNFETKSAGDRIVITIPFATQASAPASSTRQSASVEKDPATPSSKPQNQLELAIATRTGKSRLSAYTLQAKARALRLEDLQTLEDKAKAGDPEAQTTLALAYHAGVLLKRDDAEALRLLHTAANQGFMAAQESLGIFSESGIGMEQPAPAEALEWYKKAVRQGSVDAATDIALMYADGIGVPKDPAQAVNWFRQAADGGDPTAQYNLAVIYRTGTGIPQDYSESVRWLTAAAEQDVVPALLDLATFYMHPPDGTVASIDRAVHYYEKAGDLGSARAQVILGNIFADGVQGKPNYEEALKWYRMAADQGQPDAQFGLAVRYLLGQGVPVDREKARRLFTDAADRGQVDAQYDLATMCEDGNGGPADRSLAAHYYQLAADQGMPKAQFRLGRLLASDRQSPKDRVSAYKWLMLAQTSIKDASPHLSDLRKSMNEQEMAEADREVDNWRFAHPERRP